MTNKGRISFIPKIVTSDSLNSILTTDNSFLSSTKYLSESLQVRNNNNRRQSIIPTPHRPKEISNKLKMNKAAIVDAVHAILGGTKVQAEQAVDVVFDSIVNTLKKGEEVSIAGLGIFSVKQRAARDARNPRTGETIKVAAMKVPKFRAAKALKDAVK